MAGAFSFFSSGLLGNISRWVFSTSHKDIGTLYFCFGAFSGVIGTTLSMIIRLQLASTHSELLLSNHQVYNVVITSHALIMIFLCAVVLNFCPAQKMGPRLC